MSQTVNVPCNGCTACCRGELILLHPENGDDVSLYETMDVKNPLTGIASKALTHKPNGDCFYLAANGCTIHDTAPVICRKFDCRRFVKLIGNRADRRKAATGSATVRAGIERMKTL